MDFARDLCHNPGHHQLAAGPCPAHNQSLHLAANSSAVFGMLAPHQSRWFFKVQCPAVLAADELVGYVFTQYLGLKRMV
jgi:hypothetical protein